MKIKWLGMICGNPHTMSVKKILVFCVKNGKTGDTVPRQKNIYHLLLGRGMDG